MSTNSIRAGWSGAISGGSTRGAGTEGPPAEKGPSQILAGLLAHQAALERRHRRQFAALAAGLSGFATLAVLMLSGVIQ